MILLLTSLVLQVMCVLYWICMKHKGKKKITRVQSAPAELCEVLTTKETNEDWDLFFDMYIAPKHVF